jgi:hypothetical protein
VREWLEGTELDLGCPSYTDSADLSEFDVVRRRYGLCPAYRRNDGYLMVENRFWSFCHAHRVRWEIDANVIDGFVVFGAEQWDDEERPVGKYTRVIPLSVAKREAPPEEWVIEGQELDDVEEPESPGRPHLHLVDPEPTYRWPRDKRDVVEVPAEMDYSLGIIPLLYLLLVVIPKDLVSGAREWLDERRERREWSAMNRD